MRRRASLKGYSRMGSRIRRSTRKRRARPKDAPPETMHFDHQPYDRAGWFYTKGKAEASAKRMSKKGYHYRIVHAKGYYWLYVRR
ncbi:MAG: hypothetical protein ACXQS4_05500 [Methermicoccaceae archaeon]